MIKITLPDKSKRIFDEPPSIFELAQDIGPGLAKATLAGVINGEEHDACDLIEKNSEVSILTNKDQQGIDIILLNYHYFLRRKIRFSPLFSF